MLLSDDSPLSLDYFEYWSTKIDMIELYDPHLGKS